MGSDHLMMEADSPRAGASVGREKVIREVIRCRVSTSPSSSNNLGNIVMVMGVTEKREELPVKCLVILLLEKEEQRTDIREDAQDRDSSHQDSFNKVLRQEGKVMK